jgi:hypothetical protein
MDILMAIAGALSIYLGYKLFCDCAYQKSRMRHLMSGALLALFGLGILMAEARNIRTSAADSRTASRRKKSTEEGSFEAPRLNKHMKVTERLI